MNVQPRNLGERIFAVTVLIVGLILFSSFVSSITASMTQLRTMQGESSKQLWLLRRYLKQRAVSPTLTFRILRYIEHLQREQRHQVQRDRVQLLSSLTDSLQSELEYEVSYQCLSFHALFSQIIKMSKDTMPALSQKALQQVGVAQHEVLCKMQERAYEMYFVAQGVLHYYEGDPNRKRRTSAVKQDDWVAEPALWTEWYFVGEVKAATEGSVIRVNADQFHQVVICDPPVWRLVAAYAANYVKWLNEQEGDCTDLSHQGVMSPVVACFLQTEATPTARMSLWRPRVTR